MYLNKGVYLLITIEDIRKHTTKTYADTIMLSLQKGFVHVQLKQITTISKNAYKGTSSRIHVLRHVEADAAIKFYSDLLNRDSRKHVQVAGKKKLLILKKTKRKLLFTKTLKEINV